VPSQAGLGGGSSNAAAALVGVNRLLDLGLDPPALRRLAARLGSDVPFFLVGGTGVARGRGEAVTSLDDGPGFWFVIVKPDISISTAWAYAALDSDPNRQSARATRRMEEALGTNELDRIYSRMTNDFEQAIFPEHLPIALLHDELLMARCRASHLCGSGSAMFGLCLSEPEANEAARIMRLKYESVHVCRTVGRREALSVEE
jgi:4-diphosphocytidyl-2-C-methyl-D-erythritol kinase